MKKTKLFGLVLIAAISSFTACSNDTEEVFAKESEIRLTSEITPSRVTSDLQSTQLASNRSIGVTIAGSKSGDDYVNKLWTSDGEGGLSTEHAVYWANTNVSVTAYHPYNVDWTSGTQTFTVKTDQSVEENYLDSDLLWAKETEVSKSTNAIPLTFSHKLAKVNVTLQPEYPEMDLSSAVVSICNTKTSTTIDLFDGTVPVDAIGEVKEIKAGVGLTASAIVVPQTIASDSRFIKVVLGEKTFYYTLPTAKQLKSGYSHNYTLTVKETAVEIVNSSEINDWDDEENTGDANETDDTPYLSFIADDEQTLTMSLAVSSLEYSVNNSTWTELGTKTVTFGGENGVLRLRGKNTRGTSDGGAYWSTISFSVNDVDVICEGDIRTLIDYENYTNTETSNARFEYLFANCTVLTKAPDLPSTKLGIACYEGMFYNCTSLTKAPYLPATSLTPYCYTYMFQNCTSLIEVPDFPLATLAESCCEAMFKDCTNLIIAPKLPAEVLEDKCYKEMFSGCINLTTLSELPAMALARNCYERMFSGCINLTTSPIIRGKYIMQECYKLMFVDCYKLNSVTMLAKGVLNYDWSDWNAGWLSGVVSKGTITVFKDFYQAYDLEIPEGWTIILQE